MKYGLQQATLIAITKVLANYTEVEKAILYGSRAKGNYRPGSDIDLTLIGENLNLTLLQKIETELDDLLLPYKIDLSLLNQIKNPDLLDHIQKIGILFYQKEKPMSEWREYRLGDIAEITSSKRIFYSEYVEVGVPFYRSKEIIDLFNKREIQTELYITTQRFKEIEEKYGVPLTDDILLTSVGSLGIPYKVKCGDKFYFKDGNITWFRNLDRRKVLPDFLFTWLSSNVGKQKLDEVTIGSTQAALTISGLKTIEILLPDLKTQTAIASVLSSLDNKIDLLHRQNATLEKMAETLFRQWFVDIDWSGTLTEYIKVQGGYAFKSKDFKESGFAGVIKIRNISMGMIDITKTDFVDMDVVKHLDKRFKIKSGDFLIAMTGAEIGKIGIIEKTEKEIWVNQRVGKLEAKVPYGDFIGYLALKSREGQDHILNACAGSAQENISSTGIEEMSFVTYDEERANSFGKEVKPLFQKIIFNQAQIRTLTALRDTLLPKLMSGEITVKI